MSKLRSLAAFLMDAAAEVNLGGGPHQNIDQSRISITDVTTSKFLAAFHLFD
jgi:hypothetical protein